MCINSVSKNYYRTMKLVLGITLAFSYVLAFDNSDEYINAINSQQSVWKAGRNFPLITSPSRIRGLLGAKILSENERKNLPVKSLEIGDATEIPTSFDARTHWSKCDSIKEIADQSACGSCWAVSLASTIQDRICIHSDGKQQPRISARNLMSCEKFSHGCKGGYPMYGWLHWEYYGLVTGGLYDSNVGCQPYPFPPCEHHTTGSKPNCPEDNYVASECIEKCDNAAINYTKDLTHGRDTYFLDSNTTEIQLDIMTNGPVVGIFNVYTDFLHYKSGVYVNTTNTLEGLHAVRIIGWGEEKDTKYWLVANSWNEDWGEKGLFKIRRGTNECGIEGDISAGFPKF